MSVTFTRRAVLSGSIAAAPFVTLGVSAAARAEDPALAAWRAWLEAEGAARRLDDEHSDRLNEMPEELRRPRVQIGWYEGAPNWAHSAAEIEAAALSPRWAPEAVLARKEQLAESRRAVYDAHERSGLLDLLDEANAAADRAYELGYDIAGMAGAGPVAAAAAAWVGAYATYAEATCWEEMPMAIFAAHLRAALPLLPEDLREAVETALAADVVAEGFRRVIDGERVDRA